MSWETSQFQANWHDWLPYDSSRNEFFQVNSMIEHNWGAVRDKNRSVDVVMDAEPKPTV